ncbi:hypothetical protein DPMN_158240 [Dreissena polymorpha]|uniref:Uncharacterized protein n=1 Tax=Dreissena polymorpha TaxID=45954 RepID=A0A9D4IN03_DREPO|nr:hypothetical protein DPMN_158240 [Dreissena polymorpha]
MVFETKNNHAEWLTLKRDAGHHDERARQGEGLDEHLIQVRHNDLAQARANGEEYHGDPGILVGYPTDRYEGRLCTFPYLLVCQYR